MLGKFEVPLRSRAPERNRRDNRLQQIRKWLGADIVGDKSEQCKLLWLATLVELDKIWNQDHTMSGGKGSSATRGNKRGYVAKASVGRWVGG